MSLFKSHGNLMDDWRRLVDRVYASELQAVLAFSGVDDPLISELISGSGSEAAILEAAILPGPDHVAGWLGRAPEEPCSPETALAKAEAAFARVGQLKPAQPGEPAGLGCVVSDAQADFRRCCLATQTGTSTRLYHFTDRSGDAAAFGDCVDLLILKALLETAGLPAPDWPATDRPALSIDHEQAPELIRRLHNGDRRLVWSLPERELRPESDEPPQGILSGSFNPLHEGHRRLRRAAEGRLACPVVYELSIRNADKLPLDYLSIRNRRRQFTEDPLALTSAPTFLEKAALFPGAVFVVGIDTAERILDPRFYGDSAERMREALEAIRAAGCRFLVAGRLIDGAFRTLADVRAPSAAGKLFEELPEAAFRSDLSSTEHRRARRR